MNKNSELVIDNGKLTKYNGTDRELIIPDGIKRIECSFRNNHYLRKVVIPDSVVYGGWSTFEGCAYLSDIKLSEQMKTITRLMFYGTDLRRVIIPKQVNSIGDMAFSHCHSLREVIIESENIEINASSFYDSPHVLIYCKKELCDSLHSLLGVPCFALDQLKNNEKSNQQIINYEGSEFVELYGHVNPVLKAISFNVNMDGKCFKIRIKPESCIDTVLGLDENSYYSFDEIREHYISREEAMDEYTREDPNFRTDGFLYVKHRLNNTATALNSLIINKRVEFLRAVYRSLCNKETVERLVAFAPKKKNGLLSLKEYTRISCAGMANNDLMIPEIVTKAKDETTLEVFAKNMEYSAEELVKLDNSFFADILRADASPDVKIEQNENIKPVFSTEFRFNNNALQISVEKNDTGEVTFKNFSSYTIDRFSFAKGSVENGFDINVSSICDTVMSEGLTVTVIFDLQKGFERSWEELLSISDYLHSAKGQKDFDIMVERIHKGRFFLQDKNKIDSVIQPDKKFETCVFAILSSYNAVINNHIEYAKSIVNQLPRKKNGTLSINGGLRGISLVQDADVANRGVRSSLYGKAESDSKVTVMFNCYPEWL